MIRTSVATATDPRLDERPAPDTTPYTEHGKWTVHFRNGLLGFPECRRFTLHTTRRDGLYWLQSAEDSALAFLLMDPFHFISGYSLELNPAEVAELEPVTASDLVVLAIVTLADPHGSTCTVNLQGPLIIDLPGGRAKQIVLPDTKYGVRYPVELAPNGTQGR